MFSSVYRAHGEFCAKHPWEVIVATLSLVACITFVDVSPITQYYHLPRTLDSSQSKDQNILYVLVMTAIRCITILYSYYQFCKLQKLRSKYILGIAGLFTVLSSFIFSSSVINFLKTDFSDLKDAFFFFLLLMDLSKATLLAQFALSSPNQDEVKHNIAEGMALLGPSLTLDTLVETLVISMGTLSGIRRLEVLCCFACISAIVNYVVFMTFYPACLSLILELSDDLKDLCWVNKTQLLEALKEHDQKPNPVVERVKMIMSAGLVVVHLYTRWDLLDREEDNVLAQLQVEQVEYTSDMDNSSIQKQFLQWITAYADQILVFLLLLALTLKFFFFEGKHLSSDNVERSMSFRDLPTLEVIPEPTKVLHEKSVQTIPVESEETDSKQECDYLSVLRAPESTEKRDIDECATLYKAFGTAEGLTDEEVKSLVSKGHIAFHELEVAVKDHRRGVDLRRQILTNTIHRASAVVELPFKNYDYTKVYGVCCENVIGYVPVPVGIAGPLLLDGKEIHIPMATTEGCLVASTNRGCRALSHNGVISRVHEDGMTRGPVVRFPNAVMANEAKLWLKTSDNFSKIKERFDSTSRFARLNSLLPKLAGRYLYIRFVATTGDAMGMNMLSKGTECALNALQEEFPEMEILSLSGNFCADKKATAINWIEGRGRSVVCEAIVPAEIVSRVLKTTTKALIDLNISKNLMGSAVSGSIGGYNAHAANIVTAIYIATGQDPAQNVVSSNCMTLIEGCGKDGLDLYMTCTMPSIELGTIGGGTQLPAQSSCLEILGVSGSKKSMPGENANTLARIVCATVLAGELSLMSALAAGHLVRSHLKHNRSSACIQSSSK